MMLHALSGIGTIVAWLKSFIDHSLARGRYPLLKASAILFSSTRMCAGTKDSPASFADPIVCLRIAEKLAFLALSPFNASTAVVLSFFITTACKPGAPRYFWRIVIASAIETISRWEIDMPSHAIALLASSGEMLLHR